MYTYGIDVLKQFSDNGGNVKNVKFRLHNDTDDAIRDCRPEGWRVLRQGFCGKEGRRYYFVP